MNFLQWSKFISGGRFQSEVLVELELGVYQADTYESVESVITMYSESHRITNAWLHMQFIQSQLLCRGTYALLCTGINNLWGSGVMTSMHLLQTRETHVIQLKIVVDESHGTDYRRPRLEPVRIYHWAASCRLAKLIGFHGTASSQIQNPAIWLVTASTFGSATWAYQIVGI